MAGNRERDRVDLHEVAARVLLLILRHVRDGHGPLPYRVADTRSSRRNPVEVPGNGDRKRPHQMRPRLVYLVRACPLSRAGGLLLLYRRGTRASVELLVHDDRVVTALTPRAPGGL